MPHEFNLWGIYLPPILIDVFIAVFLASVTARLLNKYQLANYFANPPLVYITIVVIYTMLVGLIIPF